MIKALLLAAALVLTGAGLALAQWLPVGLGQPPVSSPFNAQNTNFFLASGNNTALASGNNVAW